MLAKLIIISIPVLAAFGASTIRHAFFLKHVIF